MKKRINYLWVIVLSLLITPSIAQTTLQDQDTLIRTDLKQDSHHFLHAELGGRTIIMGSLNYEYALKPKFHLGVGAGLVYLNTGRITRDNNGTSETGNYFEMSTTQMLYGNYFVGENKSQLVLTAGLTNFLTTYRNDYPSELVKSSDGQIQWNVGVGYQYNATHMFYRMTAYCIAMPQPSGWFPDYIPWAGITIGYILD